MLVAGPLSVTQDNNTVSATGAVTDNALNIAQDDNTVSATGTVLVAGSLSVTQDNNTVSATGAVQVTGSLSATQDDQTLAAVAITTGLSVTQDDQTLSATAVRTLFEAPCVLRAAVVVHAIVATASYVRLSASASYPRIRYRTCWNVVADREAA